MTDISREARPDASDILEPTARALCLYIVRIALLPWNMLLIRPSRIARSVESGAYRPLPPPYLLTLIAGVAVSGVVMNTPKLAGFSAEARADFVNGVFQSMTGAEDMGAVLLAIPYIAAIWIFSGLVSFSRGQGFRNVEPMFAYMSYSVAAIVQIGLIALIGAHLIRGDAETFTDTSAGFLGAMAVLIGGLYLVLLAKLPVYLWHTGSKTRSSWFGMVFGFLLAFIILTVVTAVALVPASILA